MGLRNVGFNQINQCISLNSFELESQPWTIGLALPLTWMILLKHLIHISSWWWWWWQWQSLMIRTNLLLHNSNAVSLGSPHIQEAKLGWKRKYFKLLQVNIYSQHCKSEWKLSVASKSPLVSSPLWIGVQREKRGVPLQWRYSINSSRPS